jgi:anti-sigma regulatory factor (Ser/Thr protein kinase)
MTARQTSVYVDTSAVLPTDATAPRVARQLLVANGWFLPEQELDAAVLLASELVTNAVRHGRPDITLSIRTTPDTLRVAVHDQGAAFTSGTAELVLPTQDSGRGLIIVAALATTWGVAPSEDPQGKSVWFELRTARPR